MTQRIKKKHLAPASWNPSVWKRIECEQTPAKIGAWLREKLVARGLPVYLYQPVTADTPGVIACTCVKDGNSVADRPCRQCYGTKLVPGYEKFLHVTLWAASADAGSYTLTNTTLDTSKKPHRLVLTAVATTGTIVTPDQPYTNPSQLDWETHVDSYVRETGNTVTVEFSTDLGTTWNLLNTINGLNKPINTGVIRFRVTLTRTATTDRSPAFEILRMRRVLAENVNKAILCTNDNFDYGHILILRTWMQERSQRDVGRGVTNELPGDRCWTTPLDFFDTSLTHDTPPCRVDDRGTGPHPFYEHSFGIRIGERIVLTNSNFNETLNRFTWQDFNARRSQDDEHPYSEVF